MSLAEIIILAIGLSTDAFAVSVCKGLASKGSFIRTGLACGVWFGFFQALMPFIGWLLGSSVSKYIESIAPYVAFGLLSFLGIKMIAGSLRSGAKEKSLRAQGITEIPPEADSGTSAKVMFSFAIATSIDALAAGLSLAAVGLDLAHATFAVLSVGTITFLLSFVGAAAGIAIGTRLKTWAELAGGSILIAIGVKILAEHIIKK
ncbi:MAG: manganese efflux pump [Clostridia bacterium]|nr:manganese efflux pump [Clostridia bacterium]